jgi:hypothetical protein
MEGRGKKRSARIVSACMARVTRAREVMAKDRGRVSAERFEEVSEQGGKLEMSGGAALSGTVFYGWHGLGQRGVSEGIAEPGTGSGFRTSARMVLPG